MKVFLLKNCDTCRKTMRELKAAGHDPQAIDVRADGVSEADLARFFAEFGENIVNRRSTTWRGLDAADRAMPVVDMLRANPTLMKRPVIELDDKLYLGWTPDVRAALLG